VGFRKGELFRLRFKVNAKIAMVIFEIIDYQRYVRFELSIFNLEKCPDS